MAQKFTAQVVEKQKIAPNVYKVTFKLLSPETISFRSGQCMMLMCAPGVNRTMSIASVPQESGLVTMIADITPMGPGSKWTIGLSVGDQANFVAPTGAFFFDHDSPRKKIFVATGTGIAPYYPMIKEYLEHKGDAHVVLYWGLRFEEDMFWKEELDAWFNAYPNFSWHQVLSRPTQQWTGLTGHVTEHVLQSENNFKETEFYLCGNKAMIDEVRAGLIAKGVPANQIKTELFH